MEKGKILLIRPSEYVNKFRSYSVLVNGEEKGQVANDSYIELEVDAGPVEIQLKIDWCVSNKVKVTVRDGDTVRMDCSCTMKKGKLMIPFYPLYYTIFKKNSYLHLKVQ